MAIETNRFTFRRYLPAALLLFVVGYLSFVESIRETSKQAHYGCLAILEKLCFFGASTACFGVSLLLGRLAILPISHLHTASSAIIHYIFAVLTYAAGYYGRGKIDHASRNVRVVQTKLLVSLLAENNDTEFGLKMNFASIKDRNSYCQNVPLSTYSDYVNYIERIGKGEQNILTKTKVVRLTVSSGTTGKCKHLPSTKYQLISFLGGFIFPTIYRQTKASKTPVAPLKMCDFKFIPAWRYSEAGIPIGPASAVPRKQASLFVSIGLSTPPEAQASMPEPAQTYIHFYYALCDRELLFFSWLFGGTMVSCMEFFKRNWRQLAEDVRHGRISNYNGDMPSGFYSQLKSFPPDPFRADEIKAACEAGFEGIIKRLWPRMEVIWCVITGSQTIFQKRIKYFAGPDIKICSCVYSASEAQMGVALNEKQDLDGTFTILPTWGFFEFIPEDDAKHENPKTVFLDEVEIGKRYEIVTTSSNGLYRYRLGDIIQVVDRYNESPVIAFCTRVGAILDMRGEKTTEEIILKALHNTKWPGNGHVVEFTTSDSLSFSNACPTYQCAEGLYYVLFVEIGNLARAVNDDDETTAFDNALADISYPYKSFRTKHSIKKPKIFTMPPRTFEQLKEIILRRNYSVSNQYKTPHYTTNVDYLRFLYERAYPHNIVSVAPKQAL